MVIQTRLVSCAQYHVLIVAAKLHSSPAADSDSVTLVSALVVLTLADIRITRES